MIEHKVAIIVGSSRSDGDTFKVSQELSFLAEWDLINLSDYKISYYSYDHKYVDDDYIFLMEKLLSNYTCFICISPVYWYTVSAQMKTFLDRFTDLLTYRKDMGRRLRGKSMASIAVSVGSDSDRNYSFPFEQTAGYLGMRYIGETYINQEKRDDVLSVFVKGILSNLLSRD